MRLLICLFSLPFMVLMACTDENKVPENLLQPAKMAEILENLHLAEAYVNSNFQYSDSSKFVYKRLEDSILKAQGTQLAVFDSSMRFYQKNIKLLDEVYAMTVDSLSLKEALYK
jgi:hypothetical protein